ncbi:MAG: hypothetical protein MI862_29660 [Desulfobacterales bacterium]|nr:hypothetical protein [Desulfobacterales bacterium]
MEEIEYINDLVRQRFPFLLIDRILSCETDRKVVGLKNVTINEPYFQGHFPDEPVVPAVLLIESIAQLSSVLAEKGSVAYLTSVYKTRNITRLPKCLKINRDRYTEEIDFFQAPLTQLGEQKLIKTDDREIRLTALGRLWTNNIIADFISFQERKRAWKIMY